MKKLNKFSMLTMFGFYNMFFVLFLFLIIWATPVFAHKSPIGCAGSGLGITLFTNSPQVNIGDVISYSVDIFNGGGWPVVCDASNIQASITTPDGQTHPILLIRTLLLNGEIDHYNNITTYIARVEDVKSDGTLKATASDTGIIHQNDTDSQGGANQGVNVTVAQDTSPQLIVSKVVINDNGGSKIISDFSLFIDGISVTSSVAKKVSSGLHTVSETSDSGYVGVINGDCASDGTITLSPNDVKTCVITNNDIAPVIIHSNGGGVLVSPPITPVVPPITPTTDVITVPISPLVLPSEAVITSFPKTGFPPAENNILWNDFINLWNNLLSQNFH
jgi:hypothetical protein